MLSVPHLDDVRLDVSCKDFVDQRLITDPPSLGLLAKPIQDAGIEPDGNQLARFPTNRRTPNAPQGLQLRRR